MNSFTRRRTMGFARLSLLPILAAAGLITSPPLSDQIAVYAIVDRVVLTPDDDTPTAIQVYGTFSVSAQEPGDHYAPAVRGYLYFSLDRAKANAILAEWADLQRVAGKAQIVGFGAKYAKPIVRVRCTSEPVAVPDVYSTGMGMVRAVVTGNTVNAQIERDLKSGKAPAASCRS